MKTHPYTIDVITTTEGLSALAPAWDALAAQGAVVDPFRTHEWIQSWWECFRSDAELRVLVVRADREVIAVAPLMVTTERVYGKTLRCLRLLANDHTPRCDFIVARGSDEAYQAIWDFLMNGSVDWDIVCLRELPAESSTWPELTRRADVSGTRYGRRHSTQSPILATRSNWQQYGAALPKKRRSFLRTWLKRLSTLGE